MFQFVVAVAMREVGDWPERATVLSACDCVYNTCIQSTVCIVRVLHAAGNTQWQHAVETSTFR